MSTADELASEIARLLAGHREALLNEWETRTLKYSGDSKPPLECESDAFRAFAEEILDSLIQHLAAGDRDRVVDFKSDRLPCPDRMTPADLHRCHKILMEVLREHCEQILEAKRDRHRILDVLWNAGESVSQGWMNALSSGISIAGEKDGQFSSEEVEIFRSLFHKSRETIVRTDLRGNCLYISPGCESLTGFKREQVCDDNGTIWGLIDERDRIHAVEILRELVNTASPQNLECRFRHQSGRTIWLRITIYPILDQAGALQALEGVTGDISDYKILEEALRASEQRYRGLVENSLDGIFLVRDGRFLFTNPAFDRIFGYRPGELRCQPLIPPFDNLPMPSEEETGQSRSFVDRALTKDGDTVIIEGLYQRLPVSEKSEIQGTVMDVTARRLAEEKLRRSHEELSHTKAQLEGLTDNLSAEVERRTAQLERINRETRENKEFLEYILENAPLEVMIFSRDLTIEYANRWCMETYGVKKNEVVNRKLSDVRKDLKDLENFYEPIMRMIADGKPVASEINYTETYGKYKDKKVSKVFWAVPFTDPGGDLKRFALIMHNLTDIMDLQGKYAHAERLAATGELAARMAHGILNPLLSIASIVYVLLDSLETMKSALEVRPDLLDIQDQIKRLDKLLSDFVNLSMPPISESQKISIGKITKEVLRMIEPLYQARGVKLHAEIKGDLTLHLDPQGIRTVLYHLLMNSLDASETSGSVQLSCVCKDHRSVIQITDQGKGIRAEDMDKIFRPFYSTKPTGRGLGLSVSKRIVDEHGGNLDVSSDPEKGTTVRIVLPRSMEMDSNE